MEPDVPFFSTRHFMPHGHCYLWTPEVLWLNVVPDLLIAAAYLAIPFVLLRIARRRRDLPFNALFLWFSIFIALCGLTHAMDVWNVWHAQYWLEGLLKLATAAASLPTAAMLWRAWPGIVQSPGQKQLREANEMLARANRELEAFTASVSHDLRSPLSTIAGQAGMLEISLGSSVNDQQRERLTRIQASVKKMSELIEALLALSRISRHTLHREILDVSALAADVVADLHHADPQRNVHIAIQPGMTAHGDRRLIGDLLANLIGNAWKFTAKTADARIEIGQQTAGHMATFFVRDNGAGFDMAYEQKLFKPFQRLHGTNEFEGSGIGLATVQRIIERHGGRVWADAKPDQGALICFTLPTLPLSDALLSATAPT
ncbi:MAG TPA: ATP-binding protein [Povalibacter sp.]|uniref:sensor histidine kinase n=1 Tax=Povalibacter sp. TaxID=1962978 RepID=UPI002C487180|nr:ATP-binding protein [Povalibacter sp.]HMN45597.1 ATP-binding protein [Povalibacter sp.]